MKMFAWNKNNVAYGIIFILILSTIFQEREPVWLCPRRTALEEDYEGRENVSYNNGQARGVGTVISASSVNLCYVGAVVANLYASCLVSLLQPDSLHTSGRYMRPDGTCARTVHAPGRYMRPDGTYAQMVHTPRRYIRPDRTSVQCTCKSKKAWIHLQPVLCCKLNIGVLRPKPP